MKPCICRTLYKKVRAKKQKQSFIQTSQLSAGNYFNLIRNRESGTWEFRSAAQYAYQPASLLLEEGKSKFNQHNFYKDNSAAYLRKYNGFTQQYKAGIQGERATLKYTPAGQSYDFNASHLSLYLTPYFQLKRGKWLTTLSLPLKAERYFSQRIIESSERKWEISHSKYVDHEGLYKLYVSREDSI